MVDTPLEKKIRDTIECAYNCICTFKIKAKIVDGTYIVYLFIHNYDIDPLHIIWEGDSEEEFLKFLCNDLTKHRNLLRSKYITINTDHDIEI